MSRAKVMIVENEIIVARESSDRKVMDHLSRSAEAPERVLLTEPAVLNGFLHMFFQNTL